MRLRMQTILPLWWISLFWSNFDYIHGSILDIEAPNHNINDAQEPTASSFQHFNLRGSSTEFATNGTSGDNDLLEVQARRLQQGKCMVMATGFFYNIIGRQSGKALSVAGASTADAANVEIRDVGTGGNFNWKLEAATVNGYYRVIAQHSGKALNVDQVSTLDGANVIQWPVSYAANEEWCFKSTGDGYFFIGARHNGNNGKVLDVSGGGVDNGSNVNQWQYLLLPNQEWKLTPSNPSNPKLGNCASMPTLVNFHIIDRLWNKGLSVTSASTAFGANVEVRDVGTGGDFNWKLEPATVNGYYRVIVQHSGLALNVYDVSTLDGTNVIQWPVTYAANEEWCFKSTGDGYYFIEARHSGKNLAVAGNNVNVVQADYTGQSNQQWKLTPPNAQQGARVYLCPHLLVNCI